MTLERRLTSYDWENQFESFQDATRKGSFKPLCWTPTNTMLPVSIYAQSQSTGSGGGSTCVPLCWNALKRFTTGRKECARTAKTHSPSHIQARTIRLTVVSLAAPKPHAPYSRDTSLAHYPRSPQKCDVLGLHMTVSDRQRRAAGVMLNEPYYEGYFWVPCFSQPLTKLFPADPIWAGIKLLNKPFGNDNDGRPLAAQFPRCR